MIIKLKRNSNQEEVNKLIKTMEDLGLKVNTWVGKTYTILGLIGDTSSFNPNQIQGFDVVEEVTRIQEPYKNANRKFHPEDTVISIGDAKFGGGHFSIIAGPCSVESEDQIIEVAKRVKASGAKMLRGGAFKPRTSPYSFQGMGVDGINLLLQAKKATGLPIVSEIMDLSQLEHFSDVDVLQVGARNMQNFVLLKELGKINKPILLKRGLSATYEEFLMSAEYIMAGGNKEVILCERGIRTFESGTRNTLDISAIPYLKERTHLPIIVDPSHAAGIRSMVRPLSLAATAAGCDGLIIEVHNDPEHALCDGLQSLRPDNFDKVEKDIMKIREALVL